MRTAELVGDAVLPERATRAHCWHQNPNCRYKPATACVEAELVLNGKLRAELSAQCSIFQASTEPAEVCKDREKGKKPKPLSDLSLSKSINQLLNPPDL